MSESDKYEHSMVNMLRNVEYDLKHNIILNAAPSLQYLSLSKVAISLWKGHLKTFVSKEPRICAYFPVKNLKSKILDSIPNLVIPKSCEESLKSLIKSMGDEIENNFLRKKLVTFEKFTVYLENLCFNQQGTFNILKTAAKIIDETNLSTLEKYELACDFCLKEKIRKLQIKLSENDIKKLTDKEFFSLAGFWSLYMKEETLPTLIKGVEVRAYLWNCLLIPQSEISVHFIWENFADETWKEQLVHIVSTILKWKESGNSNICFYFSKHMSQNQLEEIQNLFYCRQLKKLKSISKWNNLVSLSEFVLALVKTKLFSVGFYMIWHLWLTLNLLNLQDLIIVWNGFVRHFKIDLEKEMFSLYSVIINRERNACKEAVITQLIIRIANPEDKKEIIYSKKMTLLCHRLLCEENPQSFDLFINQILKEEDISFFKNKFFRKRNVELCGDLIIHENYELLDKILKFFCTDRYIIDFKDMYCINILQHVLKNLKNRIELSTKENNLKLLTFIWKYLSWCFNDNKKEMTKNKSSIFDLDSILDSDIGGIFLIMFKKLINQGKWNLVRKYWKWILNANKKVITNPKEKFIFGKRIIIATYREESSLSYLKNKNCQGLLKRFIITCFTQDEAEKLKEALHHTDDLSFLVEEFLELGNLPEVKAIVEWSFSSDEDKIADFKTTFLNVFGCSMLFNFIERFNMKKVKSILKWFNPSVELVENLIENFKNVVFNEFYSENLGPDGELIRYQKNKWCLMVKKINKLLKFLTCYTKEERDLDKSRENTKKRQIVQEEIFISRKRMKLYPIKKIVIHIQNV